MPLPSPIKWRSQVILVKPETVYGTDPNPAGANAILMNDVTFLPMEGEDISRELVKPYLGNQPTLPSNLRAQLTGSTEIAGAGTAGTAPAWGPLARAAGLAETIVPATSVTYSPASDEHESVTFYVWIGPTLYKSTGARVDAVMEFVAQQIPRIRWTVTGLWEAPGDQPPATPVFTAWKQPLIVTSANTPVFQIDGTDLVLRRLALNIGNQVEPRLLVGREAIEITDKRETIEATVEATPLAYFDPFDLAKKGEDGGLVPLALTHGLDAGNIVSLNAPACQLQRPAGFEQQQGVAEWPLRLVPLPNAGDDQFSIMLT